MYLAQLWTEPILWIHQWVEGRTLDREKAGIKPRIFLRGRSTTHYDHTPTPVAFHLGCDQRSTLVRYVCRSPLPARRQENQKCHAPLSDETNVDSTASPSETRTIWSGPGNGRRRWCLTQLGLQDVLARFISLSTSLSTRTLASTERLCSAFYPPIPFQPICRRTLVWLSPLTTMRQTPGAW